MSWTGRAVLLAVLGLAAGSFGFTAEPHVAGDATGLVAIPSRQYRVVEVSGESPKYPVAQAIDGDPQTFWHSPSGHETPLPHAVTIALGGRYAVAGFIYTPRPGGGGGTVGRFELHTSQDGSTWNLAAAGGFTENRSPTTVRFPRQDGVRFVRFTALTAQNGRTSWASVAELEFLTDGPVVEAAAETDVGPDVGRKDEPADLIRGLQPIHVRPIDKTGWTISDVSSEQPRQEAGRAIDNDPATYWHTRHATSEQLPHHLTIELPRPQAVCGLSYLPRADRGHGTVATCNVEVSPDGAAWTTVIAGGIFIHDFTEKRLLFPEVDKVRFVRFTALTATNRRTHWASAAEIGLLTRSDALPVARFSLPVPRANVGVPVRFQDASQEGPYAWQWRFPGGTPEASTARNPDVVYDTPGQYTVRLAVKNANGVDLLTATEAIEVGERPEPLAVRLDGHDNYLTTGMGILQPPWTLEMWVKGDDADWRNTEVLIGGGEYSRFSWVDSQPLVLSQGVPAAPAAGVSAEQALDDRWHHLALVCDGEQTSLLVDGDAVASNAVALPILPGAVGGNADRRTLFGGCIDEVRVWTAGLAADTIRGWKNVPLRADHPQFASLVGCWTFDSMDGEIAVNEVGRSPLGFPIRNSKIQYYEKQPLAYPIVADNPAFGAEPAAGIFSAIVLPNEWPVLAGAADHTLAKVRLVVNGAGTLGGLSQVAVDLSGCNDLADLGEVSLWLGSGSPVAGSRWLATQPAEGATVRFDLPEPPEITAGLHYLEVRGAISPDATPGHELRATIPSLRIAGATVSPVDDSATRPVLIHPPADAADVLRVLDWNIWHGGNHLGPDGQHRVLDLLKASQADIITMQESYGAQERLAEALGFHLHTLRPTENLSILSRYPLRVLPVSHGGFQSMLVEVTLPTGKKLHVASWWLRYAGYPIKHLEPDQDTDAWIADDTRLSTKDATSIFEKDILPNLDDDIPMLIGGDFNSASHLDWTAAAAGFHHGYGPVALPTSALMAQHGFQDSFRQRHPDEVARPDGSFAVIYGHLQHCRIDFIYHRGLTVLHSDVIRTHPEVDFAWPSDHAAVLTVFEAP